MLEQMFLTFMEGAVCVGAPYILHLCKNMFSSWVMASYISFWRSAIITKVSQEGVNPSSVWPLAMGCVCRCLRSSCHGFYALLRNGLWDDPAEAVTGAVYDDFVKAVGSHDLPPATAIYLTWRYCYLKCFVLIGIVWATASFDSWVPDRAALDSFAASLPQEIQPNRYETFVVIMSWWNPCLMYIWSSSFLIVLAAIFFAAPSRVCKRSNRHVSRYLVWVAWLWNFFLPFAVLLALTFRHTIDHRGLKEDLCVVAVSRSMSSPGLDLNSAVNKLEQQQLFSQRISTLLDDQDQSKVTASSARLWCQQHPDDWQVIFCQEVVDCVLTVDQRCRQEVCPSAPTEELQECNQRCLEYAQQSGGSSGQQFMESLSECRTTGSGSLKLQAPVISLSPEQASCGDATKQLEAMQRGFLQQQLNMKDQCTYASMAVDKVEYVAGFLVGVEAGKLLLPSALSILGGLAESIFNIKVLFPGHKEFPFLLLLTSFEALPIYMAMLAVAQQIVGDSTLLVTCLAFIAYVGLPALTGCLTRNLRTGPEHRWQFYRKVWLEYGLRAALGLAMFLSFSQYMRNLVGDRIVPLSPFRMIIGMLLNYYTRKTLTAVAATDAALSAFLQCELWRQAFAEADHAANKERILSLGPVLLRNGSGNQGAQLKPTETLTGNGPEANAIGRGSNVEEDQKDQNKKAEKVELGQCEALECQDNDKDQKEVAVSHPHHIFERDGQAPAEQKVTAKLSS